MSATPHDPRLEPAPPTRGARLAVALVVAAAAALFYFMVQARGVFDGQSDLDQVWTASRLVLDGVDPYRSIGPGLAHAQRFPLVYPMTTFVVFAPLALLPLAAARVLFVAGSAGLLAWAVTRDGFARLPLFLSGSFYMAVTAAQWSPLLTAAALLPGLAFVLVAKPNVGVALAGAGLVRRRAVVSAAGAAAIVALSLALEPRWPAEWLDALRATPHLTAPVMRRGGAVLLLAALRWRREEARLLLLLALVPQTTVLYEALPLFLIPRTRQQATLLALLSYGVVLVQGTTPAGDYAAFTRDVGAALVALVYLPALVMVLRRPNEGELPAWLPRLASSLPRRAAA